MRQGAQLLYCYEEVSFYAGTEALKAVPFKEIRSIACEPRMAVANLLSTDPALPYSCYA